MRSQCSGTQGAGKGRRSIPRAGARAAANATAARALTALAEGHELVHHAAQLLRLGEGGADALVLDELGRHGPALAGEASASSRGRRKALQSVVRRRRQSAPAAWGAGSRKPATPDRRAPARRHQPEGTAPRRATGGLTEGGARLAAGCAAAPATKKVPGRASPQHGLAVLPLAPQLAEGWCHLAWTRGRGPGAAPAQVAAACWPPARPRRAGSVWRRKAVLLAAAARWRPPAARSRVTRAIGPPRRRHPPRAPLAPTSGGRPRRLAARPAPQAAARARSAPLEDPGAEPCRSFTWSSWPSWRRPASSTRATSASRWANG